MFTSLAALASLPGGHTSWQTLVIRDWSWPAARCRRRCSSGRPLLLRVGVVGEEEEVDCHPHHRC